MNRRDAIRLIGLAALACGARSARVSGGGASVEKPAGAIVTRRVPSTGEALPVIGLGTWQTFDAGSSRAERAPLEEVLREYVALGGRVVDSSPMYGRAEEAVGAIAEQLGLTSKLFLATKVWISGKDEGIRQMEDSLRKLRVDTIDLMQVHNLLDVDTHLPTLRRWKKDGRIRMIGVTHYHRGAYENVEAILRREQIDFLQINYSAGEREAEDRILPLARERNVAVIANRPFGGGALLRRLLSKPVPVWAAEFGCRSWPQILLKFVVSHPAITCAIPATSKVAHLRDNMTAAYGAMPDAAMRARIARAIA